MKQPKIPDLKIDTGETSRIRGKFRNARSVKITINIDAASLDQLRSMSENQGVPYQRLLNILLRERLAAVSQSENRLERLEREVEALKTRLGV
jgi:predicted DNA binding CopG/RHH family protein